MKSKAFLEEISYDNHGGGGNFFICKVTLPSLLSDPKDPILFTNGGPLIDRATELYLAAEEFSKFFMPFTEEQESGGILRTSLFLQQFEAKMEEEELPFYFKTRIELTYEGPAIGLSYQLKEGMLGYPDKSLLSKDQGGIVEYKHDEILLCNYQIILASLLENIFYREDHTLRSFYTELNAFEITMEMTGFFEGEIDDVVLYSNYRPRSRWYNYSLYRY